MFRHEAVQYLQRLAQDYQWGPAWQEVLGSEGLRFEHPESVSEIVVTDEGRVVVTSDRYLVQPVAFDVRAEPTLPHDLITLLRGLSLGSNQVLLNVLSVDELQFAV